MLLAALGCLQLTACFWLLAASGAAAAKDCLLPLLFVAAAAAVTAAFLLSVAGWVPALAADCGCWLLLLGAAFLW